MSYRCRLFSFLLVFFYVLPSVAKDHMYSFYQISIEKGLTQATVTSILQDRHGNLWLGTKKGVNLYKQNELVAFQHHSSDSITLPSNYINTITEDTNGNIWAGTMNGLAIYDRKKDNFRRRFDGAIYSSYSLLEESYFGGDNFILKYDLQHDTLTPYYLDQANVNKSSGNRVVCLEKISEHRLLLGTQGSGVYLLNTETMETTHLIKDKLHLLQSICFASDKSVYISTFNDGVYQYSMQGKLLQTFNTLNGRLHSDNVLGIKEYKGELWMCTDGSGITILNLRTRESRELTHVPGNNFTLPSNSITTLYEDKNKLLWAGSVRKGAFCIKETYIKTYTETSIGNSNGLTESAIISLYEEENGLLWIGTDGGGINLFNPITQQFTHFPSTYGDKVASIANLNNNELLVSLYAKGMFVFNKQTGKYRPFTIYDSKANFEELFYACLPLGHEVGEDKIYILGLRCWVYHPSTNQFEELTYRNNIPFKADQTVLAHSNSQFSLLISHNQVFKVNQKDDKVTLLFQLKKGTSIVSLAYDQDHTIWVATNHGLGKYDMDSRLYEEVPTKLFDSITFLVYDGKDRLWVGAQNRLFSYEMNENKFIQINYSEGFIPNEILFAYQNTSKKHYIYLGGTTGLVQISTDIPKFPSDNPEIVLSDVLMNGKSIWNHNPEVEVSHDYNSLSLKVQIHTDDVLQRNLIKYSIVKNGVSQDVETYDTKYTLPSSLSPGTYTVKASCTTKAGDSIEPIKLVELIILPPWYRSTWFFILFYFICILFVSCVAVLSYLRKAKQDRRNMYIYKQHINEEKIDFLINVNHELRTPLTLIYAPLKRLIEKGKGAYDEADLYERLQRIYHQASNMYHIINTVLDINRLENSNKMSKTGSCDINKIVSQIIECIKDEASEKDIQFSCVFDDNLSQVMLDEWKCQIIFSNILINGIKYCKAHSWITVRTQIENDHLRITISNKDYKFTDEELVHLFDKEFNNQQENETKGVILYYTKKLVDSLKGQIKAYNLIDEGAVISLEFPILEMSEHAVPKDTVKATTQQLSSKVNLKNYSLLIVEDNLEMNSFLCKTLEETFKEVFTAHNGEEALDICKNEAPDVVISDVTMPVMNGFELCNRIKTDINLNHIIVVLLTSRCNEEDENMGYKMGTDGYLKKPFDVDFLQTVIENLLNKREFILRDKYAQAEASTTIDTREKVDEEFLQKINQLIKDNLSNEKLNLNLITTEMGISRATLYHKMIKVTGMGLNDYINQIRIDKAVEYLLYSDLTIKEISQEVGFAYPRYFSTSFRNKKGITPSQFKERYSTKKENIKDGNLLGSE